MNKIDKVLSKAEDKFVLVSGLLIVITMIYVVANVIGRYGFHQVVPGMKEIVGALLVPISFFCLAWGWRTKGTFVTADFLLTKMKGKLRRGVELFIQIVALFLFAIAITYASVFSTIRSYNSGEAMNVVYLWLPVWPFRACLLVGFFLMIVRVVIELDKFVRGKDLREEAGQTWEG